VHNTLTFSLFFNSPLGCFSTDEDVVLGLYLIGQFLGSRQVRLAPPRISQGKDWGVVGWEIFHGPDALHGTRPTESKHWRCTWL